MLGFQSEHHDLESLTGFSRIGLALSSGAYLRFRLRSISTLIRASNAHSTRPGRVRAARSKSQHPACTYPSVHAGRHTVRRSAPSFWPRTTLRPQIRCASRQLDLAFRALRVTRARCHRGQEAPFRASTRLCSCTAGRILRTADPLRSRQSNEKPNNPMNPAVCVGLGADFVRTLAHRGLWWR